MVRVGGARCCGWHLGGSARRSQGGLLAPVTLSGWFVGHRSSAFPAVTAEAMWPESEHHKGAAQSPSDNEQSSLPQGLAQPLAPLGQTASSLTRWL